MIACRFAVALLGPAAVALAQGVDAARVDAELGRAEQSLQQNRADLEQLLELRLRHDLGLPAPEADAALRAPAAPTPASVEQLQRELRDEEAATAVLLGRYSQLKAAVDRLQRATAERLQREAELGAATTVPPAGRRVAGGRTGLPAPLPASDPAAAPMPVDVGVADPGAAPGGGGGVDAALRLDPLRAQIHGSSDHLRTAQALFHAGQALVDRAAIARADGRDEVARQLDDRGRERVQRALDELAPLLRQPEPPLPALFQQGRCLELLFRLAERHENLSPTTSARDYQRREQEVREPFLLITARDVRKVGARGDVLVLGPWGTAAQAAMVHFAWMNQNAGYDARPAIEALTWPGEQQQ